MSYSSKIHKEFGVKVRNFNIKVVIFERPSKVNPPHTYTAIIEWPDNTKNSHTSGVFKNVNEVLMRVADIINDRYSLNGDVDRDKLNRRIKLELIL